MVKPMKIMAKRKFFNTLNVVKSNCMDRKNVAFFTIVQLIVGLALPVLTGSRPWTS
jgi:hypothetical protein